MASKFQVLVFPPIEHNRSVGHHYTDQLPHIDDTGRLILQETGRTVEWKYTAVEWERFEVIKNYG